VNLGVLARLCAYKQSTSRISKACIVLGFSQINRAATCLVGVTPLRPLRAEVPDRSSFINIIFVEAYGSTSRFPQLVTIWYQLVHVCPPCLRWRAQVRGRSQLLTTSPRGLIDWRSWSARSPAICAMSSSSNRDLTCPSSGSSIRSRAPASARTHRRRPTQWWPRLTAETTLSRLHRIGQWPPTRSPQVPRHGWRHRRRC
jgi:hypothetical protein